MESNENILVAMYELMDHFLAEYAKSNEDLGRSVTLMDAMDNLHKEILFRETHYASGGGYLVDAVSYERKVKPDYSTRVQPL